MAPESSPPTSQSDAASALAALYGRRFGTAPQTLTTLKADGSNRLIFRLSDPVRSVVGVAGPEPDENRAFIAFTNAFRSIDLPVPEIVAEDAERGVYLEQDLGDVTLLRALDESRRGPEIPGPIVDLYRQALRDLVRFQVDGAAVVDFSLGFPTAEFGAREMLWDLNYFKYDFLKVAGIPFSEAALEEDFSRLTAMLLDAPREYFVYRDFQPRNIMVHEGRPWYIDYQGGRRGALQYDVVSLLYSSRAALGHELREQLLEDYLEAASRRLPLDRPRFLRDLEAYRLLRLLQLFGAYGFRGLVEGRKHFIESIPFAAENVATLFVTDGLPDGLPELRRVLETIASRYARPLPEPEASPSETTTVDRIPATRGVGSQPASSDSPPGLTVHIASFSFKQGYPPDGTGHGGGFVFDCRALHNPGRYEEYRGLCGLDEPVRTFLAAEDEVGTYIESVRRLVGPAIETYRRRGFEHLSVAFGCTGGQHRSVYAAESLAQWIRERFPDVAVEVHHRERERWPATSAQGGAAWTR